MDKPGRKEICHNKYKTDDNFSFAMHEFRPILTKIILLKSVIALAVNWCNEKNKFKQISFGEQSSIRPQTKAWMCWCIVGDFSLTERPR